MAKNQQEEPTNGVETAAAPNIGAMGFGDISMIRSSLQGVTTGLATAFETTLIALVLALILQLWITFTQKREMSFLDECNDYCHSHVVSKLRLIDRTPTAPAPTAPETKS